MAFLKKLGIWFVSFILSVCIFTLIFGSFVNIDLKDMVGDVYTYSDSNTKTQFDVRVASYCSELDKMEAQAKAQGLTLEQAIDLQNDLHNKNSQSDMQSVKSPRSSQSSLNQQSSSSSSQEDIANIKKLIKLCSDFKNNDVSKKEFFVMFVDNLAGGLPDTKDLLTGKMSPFNGSGTGSEVGQIYYLITHIWLILNISLPIFILILLGLLFLFFMSEPKQYIRYLGKMFIRTGIWLIIPFIILQIWLMVQPVDTTPLMSMIVQGLPGAEGVDGSQVQPSGVPELDQAKILFMMLPLVLKQLYPLIVFLIGIFFVVLGIAGVLVFKLVNRDSGGNVKSSQMQEANNESEQDKDDEENDKENIEEQSESEEEEEKPVPNKASRKEPKKEPKKKVKKRKR